MNSQRRNIAISAAALTVAIIIYRIFFGNSNNNNASKEHQLALKKLPFRQQFPLARIGVQDFEKSIGYPPLIDAQAERDYSLFIMFNMHSTQRPCPSCTLMADTLEAMTKQVTPQQRLQNKVHFASVYFEFNQALFQRLNLTTVPVLMHLPPTTNLNELSDSYDSTVERFNQGMIPDFENLKSFITDIYPSLEFTKPDPQKSYALPIAIVGVVASAIALFYFPQMAVLLYNLITNHTLLGVLGCIFALSMSSGYQWIRIRNAPHQGQVADQPASGMQAMVGFEAQRVFLTNAIASISIILLTSKGPSIKNRSARMITTAALMLAVIASFASEMNFFRAKVPQYPFKIY